MQHFRSTHPGTGEAVLIVDDEPLIRMLVREVVEELGYAPLEAGDAAAALAMLRPETRIDLLLADLGLPGGMNGRQMADAARQSRPDLKVLFITGYVDHPALDPASLEPGMQVMMKPFSIDHLAGTLQGMITSEQVTRRASVSG